MSSSLFDSTCIQLLGIFEFHTQNVKVQLPSKLVDIGNDNAISDKFMVISNRKTWYNNIYRYHFYYICTFREVCGNNKILMMLIFDSNILEKGYHFSIIIYWSSYNTAVSWSKRLPYLFYIISTRKMVQAILTRQRSKEAKWIIIL
jgi:hypothetical protein